MAPNYPINSPLGSEVNMGRFARLAHAIHLLSQAIRHTTFHFTNLKIQEEEVVQLDRTIRALMVVCEQESERTRLRFCNPLSVCASSLMLLHSHYLPGETLNIDLPHGISRDHSWIVLKELSRSLAIGCRETIDSHSFCLAEISPFVLHSVYETGVVSLLLAKESSYLEDVEAMRTVKETLKMKNRKWRVAGRCSNSVLDLADIFRLQGHT